MEGRDPSQYLKQKTISKVLRGFYRTVKRRSSDPSRPRGRSWKNVLSIGDSTAERFAVQDVVLGRVQRDRRGRWKEWEGAGGQLRRTLVEPNGRVGEPKSEGVAEDIGWITELGFGR